MVSSFVAILATLALSALAAAAPMGKVLGWLGIHNAPVLDAILRGVSMLISLLVSWLVFSWMIARLPREPVSFASSIRAALIAAIGFELFKLVGVDLPEVRAAQPGGCHLRAGAGLHGVRVRHRTAAAVRHRMGGDVDGKPGRRAGGTA